MTVPSFEIRTGPRGPGAFWEGRQLTSSYDPVREARTWAEGREWAPGALVFVAGDPWGLAAQALASRGVRAVALVPGAAARPWVPPGVETWAPEDGSLETFLADVFEATGPDAVVWEVWPAFERQAPEVCLGWTRRFRDLYRTVQGSWLTQRRFGPRQWRNALRNLVGWNQPIRGTSGTRPLVIAASGPSLDDGLGHLARFRDRFDLWALPSSFETLVRRGIVPDAGIATDGGFYAREHLQRLANTRVPVLAALSSAPDPVLEDRRCLFLSQGLPVEQELLGALAPGFPQVPSQGTVAVTALRLALEATSGPVFIAGLDLSFRDLRGHTSPHTVDRRFETQNHRLAPSEGLWADRLFAQAPLIQDGVRTSSAMLTYAGWFRSRAQFSRPVYRIAPSALHWDTMAEIDWDQARALWESTPGNQPVTWEPLTRWPGREGRQRAARTALNRIADRCAAAAADDPWLVETARTAVPEALAEDFRSRRVGHPGTRVKEALPGFLETLKADLG